MQACFVLTLISSLKLLLREELNLGTMLSVFITILYVFLLHTSVDTEVQSTEHVIPKGAQDCKLYFAKNWSLWCFFNVETTERAQWDLERNPSVSASTHSPMGMWDSVHNACGGCLSPRASPGLWMVTRPGRTHACPSDRINNVGIRGSDTAWMRGGCGAACISSPCTSEVRQDACSCSVGRSSVHQRHSPGNGVGKEKKSACQVDFLPLLLYNQLGLKVILGECERKRVVLFCSQIEVSWICSLTEEDTNNTPLREHDTKQSRVRNGCQDVNNKIICIEEKQKYFQAGHKRNNGVKRWGGWHFSSGSQECRGRAGAHSLVWSRLLDGQHVNTHTQKVWTLLVSLSRSHLENWMAQDVTESGCCLAPQPRISILLSTDHYFSRPFFLFTLCGSNPALLFWKHTGGVKTEENTLASSDILMVRDER